MFAGVAGCESCGAEVREGGVCSGGYVEVLEDFEDFVGGGDHVVDCGS